MSEWTKAREDLLRELWPDGCSASVIAARLGDGLSRNAVIGKAHRMGLTKRGRSGGRPKNRSEQNLTINHVVSNRERRKRDPGIGPQVRVVNPVPAARPALTLKSKPVPFLEVPSRGRCKFPLWPDMAIVPLSEKMVCGGECAGVENPYCEYHDDLCNTEAEPRRRRARPKFSTVAAGTIAA